MKYLLFTLFALALSLTTFADSLLIEGFEYGNHDLTTPVGWTCNDQSWLCGYLEKDHNRIPHTGNWYAFTDAEECWMFMPMYLSSQLKYRFACWAISDGNYDLEFWAGNEAVADQMTHCLGTFNVDGGDYDKMSVYIETLPDNYEFFGIRAVAHEGASRLTIDDVRVDMVARYEFMATPSNADTVLYPASQASYHFDVQNLGYTPIEVILSPSHEYFDNFHYYVEGEPRSTFPLEPDETKSVVVEATLLPSVEVGSICWLDIMLLLDCDCATAMTTLWVTVIEPLSTEEVPSEVTLYPNPASDQLTIEAEGLRQVEVYDLTGKKVLSASTTQDKLPIDMTSLNTGIYLVRMITEQGVSTKKVLKK